MSDRLHRAIELFVRLLGVGAVVVGLVVTTSSPLYGVAVVAVGLLFALRPYTAGEIADALASLF